MASLLAAFGIARWICHDSERLLTPPHLLLLSVAYTALGAASAEGGPLEGKTRALVKLAIAVGGQMEGAVHSHTRRAVEAGCSAEEIRHVALLGVTTIGFPSMMKTLSWVEDVIGEKS